MKIPLVTQAAFRTMVLLSWVGTAFFCGCGHSLEPDYSSLNLATAYGTVTANGTAVVGVTVFFEAEDKTYSSGVTDSSGYYELLFNSEKEGVTPGPKIVRIRYSSGDDEDDEEDSEDGGNGSGESAESIPAKYNSNSELQAVIKAGDSHQFDFDLVM